jgi:hypothetical protein
MREIRLPGAGNRHARFVSALKRIPDSSQTRAGSEKCHEAAAQFVRRHQFVLTILYVPFLWPMI